MFAWKRLRDGEIVQTVFANTKDELFESCGFGAVKTDEPIRGFLAVKVERVNSILSEPPNVEVTGSPALSASPRGLPGSEAGDTEKGE